MPTSRLEEALAREREFLLPCVYHFYGDEPLMLTRGEGCTLHDDRGQSYLDLCSGIAVMALGHAHLRLTRAITQQTSRLQHACTVFVTEEYSLAAERLASIAPGNLRRSFFVNSGSEANEGALLLARLATRKSTFVSLRNSLHGRTHMTMSVTGLPMWRTDPDPSPKVRFAPAPHCVHCELGLSFPQCRLACAESVREAIAACQGDFAALILEPIQGNGGIVVPPEGYLRRVAALVHEAGGLLIADEVQTGLGRTGAWFACEHWGVVPDILTTAKALGGGTPLGAFITTDEIAKAYTRPGGSTLGGNPVACRAALATIDAIESLGLRENASARGRQLIAGLRRLAAEHAVIGDIRGLGLMVGAEIVDPTTGQPDATLLERLHRRLRHCGVVTGKTGPDRNVLTFQPPLIITAEQIEFALSVLAASLAAVREEALA
jgi:4-aminobutyrate aminotransferase-like enzyme